MESKRSETFCGFFLDQKTPVGTKKYQRGAPWEEQPTRACLGAQAHPGGLFPPQVSPEPPLYSINTPILQKP